MEAYYPVDHLPLEFSLGSKIYPTSPSRAVWVEYELMMQILLENTKIKIIWVGTLTLVYIYTKNLFSIFKKIFCWKLKFI